MLYKIIMYVPDIGLAVRVFANGPGDLGSIPGRVIPKTQKMVLDASLLNTQHYKVRIKGKVGQSREGVAPSPTPWCSSYRKGSLWVTLDNGRQQYMDIHYFKWINSVFSFFFPYFSLMNFPFIIFSALLLAPILLSLLQYTVMIYFIKYIPFFFQITRNN